jgi:hypothetical protein
MDKVLLKWVSSGDCRDCALACENISDLETYCPEDGHFEFQEIVVEEVNEIAEYISRRM